ncbi:MAG: hypothetical protein GY754_24750 [bacterium]|nr:hypothetical protein [bacterium]
MEMDGYQFCILEDEVDYIEYEKGLFSVFRASSPDGFLMKNYQVIEDCRLKPYFSYSDLVIYAIKKDEEIVTAMAFNLNINQELQLEKMKFNIDNRKSGVDYCEGINFFSTLEKYERTLERFGILVKWGNFAFEDLKKRGINRWFGSCDEKLMNFYKVLKCEFIGEIDLDGITEHLFFREL